MVNAVPVFVFLLIFLTKGLTCGSLKNYSEAISDFNQAIKLNPNFAEAYRNRGTFYAIFKDYPEAISDITQAIKLNPNVIGAYYLRGLAYAD